MSQSASQSEPPEQSGPTTRASRLSQADTWVDQYGEYLFKFAVVRLRDESKAEDAVQETFLAALKSGGSFAGQSSEKSWLVGILKNKIFDYYRKAARESSFTDLQFYTEQESESFLEKGAHEGGWASESAPSDWEAASGAGLDREEFWKAFRACSEKLPKSINTVFTLREVDEMESREICSLLNITESNLWVMLHRARMALRRCLETNWVRKNL